MAHGYIARGALIALLRFCGSGLGDGVGVRMRQFPNGGFWARFVWRASGASLSSASFMNVRSLVGTTKS